MELTAKILQAAEYIKACTPLRPKIGLILGSGLGDYADALEDAVRIPYSQIPNFPVPTVPGHCGMQVVGISCVTNMAAGVLPVKLSHAEVMETAALVHDKFQNLLDIVLTVL